MPLPREKYLRPRRRILGGEELVFAERHNGAGALHDRVAQRRRLHEDLVAIEARSRNLRFEESAIAGSQVFFRRERGARHLPAAGDDAHELEKWHGAGERCTWILGLDDEVDAVADRLHTLSELSAQRLHAGDRGLAELGVELLERCEPGFRSRAALARDLAPDEVHRLNARGALVDRRYARIAQVLRG